MPKTSPPRTRLPAFLQGPVQSTPAVYSNRPVQQNLLQPKPAAQPPMGGSAIPPNVLAGYNAANQAQPSGQQTQQDAAMRAAMQAQSQFGQPVPLSQQAQNQFNQFQQQQQPFQPQQFLNNIQQGTGSLGGSQQGMGTPQQTGATGTSATAVPPDVMDRYNQVNQAQPSPMPQQPQSQSQGQGSGQGAGSFSQVGSAGGSPGGPSSMPSPQAQYAGYSNANPEMSSLQGALTSPGYSQTQPVNQQAQNQFQQFQQAQGQPPQATGKGPAAQQAQQSAPPPQATGKGASAGRYADGGEVMPGQSLLMMDRMR